MNLAGGGLGALRRRREFDALTVADGNRPVDVAAALKVRV